MKGFTNFSRTDYDGDAYKNSYSVGAFVPVSTLGVSTDKWQVPPSWQVLTIMKEKIMLRQKNKH